MKFFEMEFFADGVSVYRTQPYDNVDAVLNEVRERRSVILDLMAGTTIYLEYDSQYLPDSPENENAVSLFDSWISDFDTLGFPDMKLENREHDVFVEFHHRSVQSCYLPELFENENLAVVSNEVVSSVTSNCGANHGIQEKLY